jgi:glycosyltransferase involved in cell wall biosynthesis
MAENKKTTVLQCIRQGKIGGGETHVLDLVAGLDKNRFAPVVLSFTDGEMVERLQQMQIPVHVIYTEKGFDFRAWGKVRELMQKTEIQLVHAHGTRACSNVFQPAKSLKIPLIYTIHGWSFHQDQKPFVRKLRELSEKFLTSQADLNIAVSKSNEQDGRERFNMQRSTTIYNAINLQKFNPDQPFPDLRTELGILPSQTLIGYIVRLTHQKDPFTLIRAFQSVAEATPDVKLLMVGDGDLKEEAVRLAQDLGLGERIIFQPFRQDVPAVLQAIDVYCLPSLWEGFSIGLLEAMAMRKAVVATPVDGTKEVIQNGENGLLIPHQNPEKLAESLLQLHRDKPLREKLAENAYQTVIKNFTLERMVKEVEKQYELLMTDD